MQESFFLGNLPMRTQEIPNRLLHLVRAPVTILGILGKGTAQDPLELGRLGSIRHDQNGRLFAKGLEKDRLDGITGEQYLVRQNLEEGDTEAEDIRAAVGRLAAKLLRRHIAGCSDDDPGLGLGGMRYPGDTEIHDFGATILGDENIRRFDIPVNDTVTMGVRQPPAYLSDDLEPSTYRERIRLDELIEVSASEQLHGDEGRAVLIIAEVVNRDDVGVVEPGDRPGFALETHPHFLVINGSAHHDLDGHVALEKSVMREVDHPHAASADQTANRVLAQLTGWERLGHRLILHDRLR
jgi:hypothetical protein